MPYNLPTNGRGGSLYYQNLTVQTYQGTSVDFTLAELDLFHLVYIQQTCAAAVCFGALLMAFLQVVALTNKTKRGLPLYSFSLVAISAEAVRFLCEMVNFSLSGYYSAYFMITTDYANSNISLGAHALDGIPQMMSLISFSCIQCCLFVQGKAILSAFRQTHARLWILIMGWLVGLGAFTLIWRIMVSVWSITHELHIGVPPPMWIYFCVDIFYSLSIGSWSLIFTIQVAIIIYKRIKLGGSLHRTEAMKILLMVGIESLLLPIFFCVLQFVISSWLLEPEIFIVPSVAIILPFGSLCASATQAQPSDPLTLNNPTPAGTPIFLKNERRRTNTELSRLNAEDRNLDFDSSNDSSATTIRVDAPFRSTEARPEVATGNICVTNPFREPVQAV